MRITTQQRTITFMKSGYLVKALSTLHIIILILFMRITFIAPHGPNVMYNISQVFHWKERIFISLDTLIQCH